MRINRKTRQSALDLPLGPASYVGLVYEAVQGYRAAVEAHLPKADIVFDKFHLVSNLNEVINKVRRRTQAQVDAEGRALIKGQRYNLLRNPESRK